VARWVLRQARSARPGPGSGPPAGRGLDFGPASPTMAG